MEETYTKTDLQSVDEYLGIFDRSSGVEVVGKQRQLHNTPMHQSAQQKARDETITELLEQYVGSYKGKISFSEKIRKKIVYYSLGCVSAFILASIICLIAYIFRDDSDWHGLAAVISAFLTCAGLLIGVLKVIAEYAFPINAEQNITDIVKAIQKNDLTNRYYDLRFDPESGSVDDLDCREASEEGED